MRARWAVAPLALLVAACAVGERPRVPPAGEGVVLLGDSIMFSAADELGDELPGSTIDAVPGRTMVRPSFSDAGLPRVADLAQGGPDVWVVELGTNDAFVGSGRSVDDLVADVHALLTAIDAADAERAACVWWVLPHLVAPVDDDSIGRAMLVADTVQEALAGRPCGGPIDWPDVAAAFPGAIDADGVHLTPDGQALFAAMVADALAGRQ